MLLQSLYSVVAIAATAKVLQRLKESETVPVTIPLQQGFAYKEKDASGRCRTQADFEAYFKQAKALTGTGGSFSSARLWTSIQCNTTSDPSAAFKAAVATNTSLLVGMAASDGSAAVDNEIKALTKAASSLGDDFARLVVGVNVGNEDLYRDSDACSGCSKGATADAIVSYVKNVRTKLAATSLAGKPVGHTDTGTAWQLSTSKKVIAEVDFLGHNSHPYWEGKVSNTIQKAPELFFSALADTEKVSTGKAVWVTETGWPWRGDYSGKAFPSPANAEAYWLEVGCAKLFGKRNTWWYFLADNDPDPKSLSFAVIQANATKPLYDLKCSSSS